MGLLVVGAHYAHTQYYKEKAVLCICGVGWMNDQLKENVQICKHDWLSFHLKMFYCCTKR